MDQKSILIQCNKLRDFSYLPSLTATRKIRLRKINFAEGVIRGVLRGRESREGKVNNSIPFLFHFNARIPFLVCGEVDAFGVLLIRMIPIDPNLELIGRCIEGDCARG